MLNSRQQEREAERAGLLEDDILHPQAAPQDRPLPELFEDIRGEEVTEAAENLRESRSYCSEGGHVEVKSANIVHRCLPGG